ncbi:MAG: hypothetical protein MZV64_09450 [Ignavibacteriales bacterium]|nr:hypothetical protein [Ignavibacteriales bacterium]
MAEILTALRHLIAHPEIAHGPDRGLLHPRRGDRQGHEPLPPREAPLGGLLYPGRRQAGRDRGASASRPTRRSSPSRVTSSTSEAARGKLANATAMAASFITMLPRAESPESTDGWYGYYCPIEVHGTLENATLEVFLRDFTDEGMNRRIETVKALAKAVEAQFPGGSVEVDVKKQYLNMRKKLDERPEVLERLVRACKDEGIHSGDQADPGGTDGARLTEMGVPTPNIFTGGYNYHSRYEMGQRGGDGPDSPDGAPPDPALGGITLGTT